MRAFYCLMFCAIFLPLTTIAASDNSYFTCDLSENTFHRLDSLYLVKQITKQELIRSKFNAIVPRRQSVGAITALAKSESIETVDLTNVIREININISLLSPDDQKLFLTLFDRPTDHPGGVTVNGTVYEFNSAATVFTWRSAGSHFLVHYTVDDVNDATNAIPTTYRTDSDDCVTSTESGQFIV